MNFSFNCSEQAPQSSAREVERRAEALSPLLRDHYVPSSPIVGPAFYDVCEVWDVDPADEALYEPVESDVPTLVVTGEFDQITPPSYGEEVAASLGRATLLEARGQGHSPLLNLGACGIGILEEFLLEPDQPLDDACVRKPITFEPLPSAG